MPASLEIRTLGGLTIQRGNALVTGFDSRKVPALLVYLACTRREHPREVLAEMLWEERTQAQALANLRVALHSLNQTAGEYVEITRESVKLNPAAAVWLDAEEFEQRLHAAGSDDAEGLDAALALYGGDFLAGFFVDSSAVEQWATRERERLRLRAMEGLDRLIGARLARGEYAAGIAASTRLLDMDPLREETHRQLMRLLALSGQRAKALDVFDTCRRLLEDEFGLTPLPETLALYEQLRAGELTPGLPPAAGEAAPIPLSHSVVANPYKGLCAFDEADEADFFGREVLVERLLARLAEEHPMSRFLAVVGPSGSGKSSVVRAGLIPALRRGGLPGSAAWPIVILLPGALPFEELEIALRRTLPNSPLPLLDDLRRDARGLLRALRLCLPDERQELLLVIDQFEEVFTLASDPGEARRFLDSLYVAATSPRSPVRILITLRADFYDRPLMIPDFSELVRQRTEVVTPMTPDELERAVAAPAQRVGIALESGLIAAVVADVSQQPGALPLMEYALTEVFDRRADHTLTLAAYEAIGGALGALARRADEIYERLSAERQAAARQMCLRLITLGEGTEDTRRRTLQTELFSAGGETTRAALHAFDRARLLTFDRDPRTNQPTVELAHEAIIREWGQLRGWLDESRDDVRLQRLLAAAAAEWEQAGHDSAYLLTGSRLAQYENWAGQTDLALSLDERQFLDASTAEAQRQHARRRRMRNVILSAVMVVAVVMTVLALFALAQRNEAQDARATSDMNALAAQRERDTAQELALVNGAQAALAKGDPDTALALAVAANQGGRPSAQAQVVLSQAAYPPGPVQVLQGHQGFVWIAGFSPDGYRIVSMGDDGLIVWEAATGALLYRFQIGFAAFSFTPDSRQLLSASWSDASIILWDLDSGQEIKRFASDAVIGVFRLMVRVNPDGRTFLTTNGADTEAGQEAGLLLWDLATGEVIRAFRGHQGNIYLFAVSPDGRQLLSSDMAGEVILWDADTAEIVHRFSAADLGTSSYIGGMAFLPDSRRALLRSDDGTMTLWDLDTYQPLFHYPIPPDVSFAAARYVGLSPDGHTAILGGNEATVWDVETGGLIATLPTDAVGVGFSPDGRIVYTVSVGAIRLWDWRNGAELQRWTTQGMLDRTALSPDGRTLLSFIYSDPEFSACWMTQFDAAARTELWRSDPLDGGYWGCSFLVISPDGRRFLSALSDGKTILWDAETRQPVGTFSGNVGVVGAADFSPDSRSILTGGADGTIILWDAATSQEIRRFAGHTMTVFGLDFSPDGRTFLSCSQDSAIILWDVETGQEIRRFVGHSGGVNSLAFSPDGRYALSGADDTRVILWDVATGAPVHTLIGHEWGVIGVAFSPDGRSALTSDGDNLVILWDLTTGEAIRYYDGAGTWPVLDPDGRSFLVSDWYAGAVRRFRIDSADGLLAWTLDHRYVRELTCTERTQYRLEPGCDAEGGFPTRTPYPTAQPAAVVPTTTDLTGVTTLPAGTSTPSVTPRPVLVAHAGEQRGEVAVGDVQMWTYAGSAGEVLTLRALADHPANWLTYGEGTPLPDNVLDTLVIVTAPDGRDINASGVLSVSFDPPGSDDIDPGVNTDSLVEGLVLPVDGVYLIEVSGARYQTSGHYTLIIESMPPGAAAPTPEDTPSGS